MKKLAVLLLLALPISAPALGQGKKPPSTLRGVLLEQLHTTHDKEDWFVPASVAVDGLTADQAKWSPGPGNHSIGQLAYHIWYWDDRELQEFNGVKPAPFDGNNNETFDNFTPAQWNDLVEETEPGAGRLGKSGGVGRRRQARRECFADCACGAQRVPHWSDFHVRKQQGVWDPNKGGSSYCRVRGRG